MEAPENLELPAGFDLPGLPDIDKAQAELGPQEVLQVLPDGWFLVFAVDSVGDSHITKVMLFADFDGKVLEVGKPLVQGFLG